MPSNEHWCQLEILERLAFVCLYNINTTKDIFYCVIRNDFSSTISWKTLQIRNINTHKSWFQDFCNEKFEDFIKRLQCLCVQKASAFIYWTVSRFKIGLGNKEGVVFLRRSRGGELTPQCTLCLKMHFENNKSAFIEGNTAC